MRTEADPATRQVSTGNVAAVGSSQLGGQHNGADKGEQRGQTVPEDERKGHGKADDEDCKQAVEERNPRPGGDEDGEVDGFHVTVDIGGDDISDEGGDEQGPDECDDTQDDLEEVGHGGGEVQAFDFTVLMLILVWFNSIGDPTISRELWD